MAFKKFWVMVIFAVMFLLSGNVSAMTFSQPVKIGYAGSKPFVAQSSHFKGGYFIEGANYNSGNRVIHGKNASNYETYQEGLARWGEGKNALYCKYDTNTPADSRGFVYGMKFGGKDMYIFSEDSWREISKIETDEGITLYPLYFRYKRFTKLDILGCRKDGTWVKYIDMESVIEKYYGKNPRNVDVIGGAETWERSDNYIVCQGDTIIVPYHVFAYNPYRKIESGEFRFKWDDAAQWFGIEHIVY